MKKLIFLIGYCCLMYSCNQNKYHDLAKDKIPLLKSNDTICFKDSASSKIDTLCLDVRDMWGQTLEGDYFRYITIFYNRIIQNSTLLRINISSAGTTGVNFSYDEYSVLSLVHNIKTNYMLHGVTYPIVYVTNLPSDNILYNVYFTYHDGIIRYEYKDRRVYNLVSK